MAIRVKIEFADGSPEVVTSVVDTPRVGDVLSFPTDPPLQYRVETVTWNLSLQPMRTYDVALAVEPEAS